MLAADPGNPRRRSFEPLRQWLDFAHLAAAIGLLLPKLIAKFTSLRRRIQPGMKTLNADAIPLFNARNQLVSFRKEEIGIEGEDRKRSADLGNHVDQHHIFDSKARCQGGFVSKLARSPGKEFLRVPSFCRGLHPNQTLSHFLVPVHLSGQKQNPLTRRCLRLVSGFANLETVQTLDQCFTRTQHKCHRATTTTRHGVLEAVIHPKSY